MSFIAKLNSKGAAAMSNPNRGIDEIIGFQVEGTANWRRQKADLFPDSARNSAAAAELDQLAKEIGELEGSDLHRRIDELIDLTSAARVASSVYIELSDIVSAELRGIGFHGGYGSGADFLRWFCDQFEGLLREHINNDDGTLGPSLAEQVENDEAVKAAKRAYEVTYAKAYAEARKRL